MIGHLGKALLEALPKAAHSDQRLSILVHLIYSVGGSEHDWAQASKHVSIMKPSCGLMASPSKSYRLCRRAPRAPTGTHAHAQA